MSIGHGSHFSASFVPEAVPAAPTIVGQCSNDAYSNEPQTEDGVASGCPSGAAWTPPLVAADGQVTVSYGAPGGWYVVHIAVDSDFPNHVAWQIDSDNGYGPYPAAGDYYETIYLTAGPHYFKYIDDGMTANSVLAPGRDGSSITGMGGWHGTTFDITGPNYVGGSYQASGVGDDPYLVAPTSPTDAGQTSFTVPHNDGGQDITGYTAVASPGGATASVTNSGVSEGTITVTGLTNGVGYTFTVFATNSIGNGPASVESTVSRPGRAPDAPRITAVTAGDTTALVAFEAPAGYCSVTVNGLTQGTQKRCEKAGGTWAAKGDQGGSIVLYTVTSSPGGLTASRVTSPITVTGLTNGQAYTFAVKATNYWGLGVAGTTTDAYPVGCCCVESSGVASVHAFTVVAGAFVTGTTYTIASAGNTDFTTNGAADSNAGTTFTAWGAGSGTGTATFSGRYLDQADCEGAGKTWATSVAPAAIPGAPTIGAATASHKLVSVAFSAGAANGAAVTLYTVTDSTGAHTATGAASPIAVEGLTNGVAYTFTVTATNPVGTGPASAATTAAVPDALPGAPVMVAVVPNNAGSSAQIFFDRPAACSLRSTAGEFDSPCLWTYTAKSSPGGLTGSGSSSPVTVTGLTQGTEYKFTIKAVNTLSESGAEVESEYSVTI